MKDKVKKRDYFLIIAIFILFASSLMAQENEDEHVYATTIKTVKGINFRVPEDRPIEKKGGVYAPMDLDEYVAMKYSKLERTLLENIERIDASILKLNQELDSAKKQIELLKKKQTLQE